MFCLGFGHCIGKGGYEVGGQQSGTMTSVSAIHSRQLDRDGSSEEAKEEEKYRAKSVNRRTQMLGEYLKSLSFTV